MYRLPQQLNMMVGFFLLLLLSFSTKTTTIITAVALEGLLNLSASAGETVLFHIESRDYQGGTASFFCNCTFGLSRVKQRTVSARVQADLLQTSPNRIQLTCSICLITLSSSSNAHNMVPNTQNFICSIMVICHGNFGTRLTAADEKPFSFYRREFDLVSKVLLFVDRIKGSSPSPG